MRIKYGLIVGVLTGVMVASLSGCGKSDEGGKRKYLVIFSQCNNAEPYRAAQNTLLKKLLAEHDDVELVIKDGQQDNSKQIRDIEDAIKLDPDVLIVAPNERTPLTKVMGQAVKAGIAVICLERDIVDPNNYTTYIKCDNRKIGQLAGQFIVDHLTKKNGEPKGRIVDLQGLLGVEGEENRREGAKDVYGKHPDIEVVHAAVAGWLQDKGRQRMEEALSANPADQGGIDVVYGHNDPMAIGAYLAAKEAGRDKEMVFIGVDGLGGPAGGIQKVADGVLAVTFYYPLCVDKAAEITNKILRDPAFKPQKEYMMESFMITPENAKEMYEKYTFD
jgi:ribose transport system substrate-binding protein